MMIPIPRSRRWGKLWGLMSVRYLEERCYRLEAQCYSNALKLFLQWFIKYFYAMGRKSLDSPLHYQNHSLFASGFSLVKAIAEIGIIISALIHKWHNWKWPPCWPSQRGGEGLHANPVAKCLTSNIYTYSLLMGQNVPRKRRGWIESWLEMKHYILYIVWSDRQRISKNWFPSRGGSLNSAGYIKADA